MLVETRLRLLLANRRVAWLTGTIPELCVRASRFAWTNDFFPTPGLRKWARVVVLSPRDFDRGLALLADDGCLILVERAAKTEPLGALPGAFIERIASDADHVLTLVARLAPRRRPQGAGLGRLFAARKASFSGTMMGRIRAGYRQFGVSRPKNWKRFFRDLALLDVEMRGHESYYLTQMSNPGKDIDPALHYLQEGAHRGLNPSPAFSTRYYLATHPDVAGVGVNPFLHYLKMGRLEGRAALPAAFNAAHPTSLESTRFAQLTRRSPARDLWLGLGGGAWAEVDWTALAEAGPLSLVVISQDDRELAAWKTALSDRAPDHRVVVVLCVAHDCEDVPNCRLVRAGLGQDPVGRGLAEARHSLTILCQAGILTLAETLPNLVSQHRETGELVTARLASPDGLMLAASATHGTEPELRPIGSVQNSEWVPAGSRVPAGPFLVVGERDVLVEAATLWARGRPAEALLGSNALAIAKDTCAIGSGSSEGQNLPAVTAPARLCIEIDQWPSASGQARLAQRLMLLDLAACHGAVSLHTQATDRPLGEMAWLETFGIAWRPDVRPGPVSTPRSAIAITLRSGAEGELPSRIVRRNIALSALTSLYATFEPAREYALRTQEIGHVGRRAVALCSHPTAVEKLQGWMSDSLSTGRAPDQLLLLGPFAAADLSAQWPNGCRVTRLEHEQDWAFRMAWADTLLVPSAPSGASGLEIRPIARHALVSGGNPTRSARRLAALGWDLGQTGQ